MGKSRLRTIVFNNIAADDGVLVPCDIIRNMIVSEITHNLCILDGEDSIFGFTLKTQNPYHDGRSEYYDIPLLKLTNDCIAFELPPNEDFDIDFVVYKTRGMDGGGYKIKYDGQFVLKWNPNDEEAN